MHNNSGGDTPDIDPLQDLLRQAEQAGQAAAAALAECIARCPIPIAVLDREHRITHWNHALESLSGQPASAMLGTRDQWRACYSTPRPTLADLIIDGSDESEIARYYQGRFRQSQLIADAVEVEDFFPTVGDGDRWLFLTAAPLKDSNGQLQGAIQTLQDVTRRRRAETALAESSNFLTQIIDGSSVPTFVIDREHRVTHWNRACERLTGIAAQSVIGSQRQWQAFYPTERPVMADLILSGAIEQDVDRFYHGKFRPSALIGGAVEAEDFFPHFGQDGRWLFFTAAPLRDATGVFIGAIETLQDITEQKRAEQALRDSERRHRQLSITDGLTMLYNSRYFYEQLGHEAERANRYRHPLALLLLDADNFKQLNDTYGHLEGDRVLQTLANVIKNSLRSTDTAYRYGGEEFTVLLPETGIEAAKRLAERLRTTFANIPIRLDDDTSIHCTISIGVAEYIAKEDIRNFVRRVDDSVYQAKKQGKNRIASIPAPHEKPATPSE